MVRCKSCGTIFLEQQPAERVLLDLYRNFPSYTSGREGWPDYDISEGEREAEYRLDRLLGFMRGGRLLDIGFGRGDFVRAASRFFTVWGVDLSPRVDTKINDFTVFTGTVEDAPFQPGSFAVVSAVEVLEHLADPQRALESIHRLLEPDGKLVVQTGDADTFLAKLNLHAWQYIRPPVHLTAFTRRGLRTLLRRSGFQIVQSWSFGRAVDRIAIVNSLEARRLVRPALDAAARIGLIGQLHVAVRV